ncbi:hypothetical protein LO762_06990 [Actinocorallia sp. API 0066]|uniref:hypothetical protein n=1 Tax=Actinocorallia sp. API 0066 TaxID=2896846 RepID=UPI001E4216E3|nr:hypothetical protein [Actinocorallia sp. API 0066]MCD0448935.1 hypothetical protein [Actinocorallia sp. API 0066]
MKVMPLVAAATLALSGLAAPAAVASTAAQADCRTYSSVSVCGTLNLTQQQEQCVTTSVAQGMTERRAEVECTAFGS